LGAELQYLTEDDVKAIYREVIGEPALRYPDGLASAVSRPQQTVFGEGAYPTINLKAAALMQSLAENQPFVRGFAASSSCSCMALPSPQPIMKLSTFS